jgi:hypothetical protein
MRKHGFVGFGNVPIAEGWLDKEHQKLDHVK